MTTLLSLSQLLLIGLSLFAGQSQSAEYDVGDSNPGIVYAGDFLTLGVGARPLSMGGSFAAIADDSTATYWNPAGLGQLTHPELTFMQASINGLDSFTNLIS